MTIAKTSFKTPFKTRFIALALFASIGILNAGTASAGEIKQDMKSMKKNLRGAMNSDSVEELAPYVEALKYGAWHASNLPFDGSAQEQSTYKEGLVYLHRQLDDVDQAIKNHDLDAAKRALQKLRDTEEKYHNKLDV